MLRSVPSHSSSSAVFISGIGMEISVNSHPAPSTVSVMAATCMFRLSPASFTLVDSLKSLSIAHCQRATAASLSGGYGAGSSRPAKRRIRSRASTPRTSVGGGTPLAFA